MSTLVLVLATAMAVPGNGPESISAETEQRLDLRGEWKGVWCRPSGEVVMTAMNYQNPSDKVAHQIRADWIVDEGSGRCRIANPGQASPPSYGIYRQEKNKLTFCFRRPGEGRPTEFTTEDFQDVIILHRVKPRK